jgi:hypothetical protein
LEKLSKKNLDGVTKTFQFSNKVIFVQVSDSLTFTLFSLIKLDLRFIFILLLWADKVKKLEAKEMRQTFTRNFYSE